MFDHVHLGWLESDDYRVVAEAAGVVELPDGPEPDRSAPCGEPAEPGPVDPPPSYGDRVVLTGRWVNDDPGAVGK